MTRELDDTAVLPFGLPLGRHTSEPELDDTEPIPFRPAQTQELDLQHLQVKVAETCGPCGGTLSLEWVGRTEALHALRDWRENHRCQPHPADAAGTKEAHLEPAETTPPGFTARPR